MTHFETSFFQKFRFTKLEVKRFIESAGRDLKIAREDKFSEVRFSYSYQALVKAGITLIAKVGGVKRNAGFYCGGQTITEKEAENYLRFVERAFASVQKVVN